MQGDNCQLYAWYVLRIIIIYIYILFQLHKHRVQSTHLNEKSRQIFQSLSWLVSPCRTQANNPKLSFTIVCRNVDSGAKQSAVWAPTTKIQNIWPKPGPRMANIRKVTLVRSSRPQPAADTKLQNKIVFGGGVRTEDCAWLRVSISTSAVKRSIGEVVQSRRRPLLRPSPGWKSLRALSHLRH